MGDKPLVFIFSDSVGETAEFVVKAVASQFNSGEIDIRREAFINDPKRLQLLIREASRHKAMIAYTFVLPQLRQVMREEAAKLDIPCVDVLGPMLQAFSKIMNVDPRLEAGLVRRLDEGYFRRVTAVSEQKP
ncbi:MAG: kinase/pyrophosphorylase [Firmicutes bacterium]|nr:kinase/pyrophosphorylase [Bacillota bacterium]